MAQLTNGLDVREIDVGRVYDEANDKGVRRVPLEELKGDDRDMYGLVVEAIAGLARVVEEREPAAW